MSKLEPIAIGSPGLSARPLSGVLCQSGLSGIYSDLGLFVRDFIDCSRSHSIPYPVLYYKVRPLEQIASIGQHPAVPKLFLPVHCHLLHCSDDGVITLIVSCSGISSFVG